MGNEKKGKHYRVADVQIDRDSLKDVKTLDELKKKDIFSHLDADGQEKANAKLWADLKPAETAKAPAAAPAAAKA